MLFVSLVSYPAYAQLEEEMKILQMFYKEVELVETPSRHPKNISKVAENITIIVACSIAFLFFIKEDDHNREPA
jgi:hypothetical protein